MASPTREQATDIADLIRRLAPDTAIEMCFINMLKHYNAGVCDGIKRADDAIGLAFSAEADLTSFRRAMGYPQTGTEIGASVEAPPLSPDPDFTPSMCPA